MITDCKYPHIKVKLTGKDGNAFAILGAMRTALRKNDVDKDEVDQFIKEAMGGNYDHLLRTCMKWVTVE
jgi:hypothetical protein